MDTPIVPQKSCTKCGQSFPATTEFFHASKRDGLHSWCKPCNHRRRKEWSERNPERVKHHRKLYRERYPERVAQYKRDAVAKNPEHYREKRKQWLEQNAEKHQATRLARYFKRRGITQHVRIDYGRLDPAIVRANNTERGKKWARNNPDKVRASKKKTYEANKDVWKRYGQERRARKYKAGGTWTQSQIVELYSEQQGRCCFCGITIYPELKGDVHIEHLTPIVRGGSNWIDNIGISCAHCNKSKWTRTVDEWLEVRGW